MLPTLPESNLENDHSFLDGLKHQTKSEDNFQYIKNSFEPPLLGGLENTANNVQFKSKLPLLEVSSGEFLLLPNFIFLRQFFYALQTYNHWND